MFDLVIKGGVLVDGTGAASRAGDLAIKDGRIAEVGGRITGAARRTINADGALVTPGFIDVHTHYDGQVTWDDKIDPSFSNGITTAILGNCGVGFAPAHAYDRDRLISVMEGVEAIPEAVLREGVPWAWESFEEYMDFLGRRRFGIDVSAFIAHAPLRVFAMGDRAVRHEQATAEDMEVMTACMRRAMRAGALGLSSGRITEHMYGEDLASVPGTFAEHEELIALTRAAAETGKGIFQLVPRGTVGGYVDGKGITREARLAEHRLFEDIARQSGCSVHYLLLQFESDPDDWRIMLDETAKARSSGLPIYAHVACRGSGIMSALDGYHNFRLKPAYRAIAHLPLAERAAAMRSPDVRAAILSQEDLPVAKTGTMDGVMDAGMVQMLNARAPLGFLLDDSLNYEPTADETIGAISQRTGKPPVEVIYDHFTATNGRGLVSHMFLNYAKSNLDHVHTMLSDPNTLSSLGDGGAHVRLICDASMMPFHLSFWSRDRKRGPTLPLERMIAKISGDNAKAYGFRDRGELAVGKRADINVINFDGMKMSLPTMVHDLPSGGARLDQPTSGFIATLLNGVVTRDNDNDTGERPGRLVRANQSRPNLAAAP